MLSPRSLEQIVRCFKPTDSLARTAVLVGVLIGVPWWAGQAVARGGMRQTMALGLAGVVAVGVVGYIALSHQLRPRFSFVELPVLLLCVSTLNFRVRTANELAFNPLDPAGQFRVFCVGAALMLGVTALLAPALVGMRPRPVLTALPFRVYLFYVVAAVAGAQVSVNVVLTLYRVTELMAGIMVLVGAYRAVGDGATRRIEATLYWFVVALVGSVWIGLFVAPDQALYEVAGGEGTYAKWQLSGVMPLVSFNSVGAFGAILAIWSLARVIGQRRTGRSHHSAWPLAMLGAVTLVAAQYRTGYVMFVVGVLILLGMRRRAVLVVCCAAFAFIAMWAPPGLQHADTYVLRGEPVERAQKLSGRLAWWDEAFVVWQRSPIIGRGLLTASRFEALEAAGYTKTYGVHSTWVEALVGTGLVGFGLLASCLVLTFRWALRAARAPGGPLVPLALVTVLTVRSLTSNALEAFYFESFLLMAIAASLPSRLPAWNPAPARGRFVAAAGMTLSRTALLDQSPQDWSSSSPRTSPCAS